MESKKKIKRKKGFNLKEIRDLMRDEQDRHGEKSSHIPEDSWYEYYIN